MYRLSLLILWTHSYIGLSGFPDNVGEYTSSPTMEFEESLWSLRIYPGGYNQESKEHLSCFVACRSEQKTRASFQITILNQKGILWNYEIDLIYFPMMVCFVLFFVSNVLNRMEKPLLFIWKCQRFFIIPT